MERAGREVARACVDLAGGTYGRRAIVVCGKGNNGGDGLVAARHLARLGMRVAVHIFDEPGDLREPALRNFQRLKEEDGVRIVSSSALEIARADVAVDAIFGTGFRGMPEDRHAEAIDDLNLSGVPVVAVDIPSGVNGGTGVVEGVAVRAELTVTFGAAKLGSVLMPGAEYAGAVRVVDIGFPDDLISTDVWLTEPSDVAAALPRRPADTHKRESGVLVVVAGSRGMTGAVRLIAGSAGRIGAGLIIVAVPASILPIVQSEIVEATFVALPETADGTVAVDALAVLKPSIDRAHALAIGPGLTAGEETSAFVRDLVRTCPVPMIIDADGLNAFAGRAGEMADRSSEAVITPHAGEFSRLTGLSVRDLDADRLEHVRKLAAETRATTLLKGSRSMIVSPAGEARINLTGTPVLATAGAGDVLTGIIGGLLARGLSPMDSAASGAYIHGLAGTATGLGEATLAGDIQASIPDAVEWVMS